MISTQNATTAARRPGRPATLRLFLVVLLTAVLAACQSTQSGLPDAGNEELDLLAITVSPITDGSGGLDGLTVSGTIVVAIEEAGWMKDVRFLINGELRSTVMTAPFQYDLDTTLLADGPHSLVVEARMANGRVRGNERATFTVANEGAAIAPAPTEPEPTEPNPTEPAPTELEPTEPGPTEPEPTEPEPTEPAPTEPAPAMPAPVEPPVPGGARGFSLRGDPSFAVSSLSADQRVWFDRSLASIQGQVSAMVSRAQRDDMYLFGRTLYEFSASALLGLRATGDLRFLDALDPMLQALRAQLYDGWCDGVDSTVYVNARYGTVVEKDGYRNFRFRYESGRDYCRDTGDLNEALTHGHLAMVMYAYHVNRDLVSPAGVDYGERADFWFDYLRNDFEAKWRGRTGVAWPAMDFIDLKFSHTYNVFTLYYYFMGQRLASVGHRDAAAYLAEAVSLTDAMFDQAYVPGERGGGFVEVSAPTGDAVVYSFGAPGRSEVEEAHLEASPMTYSRYALSAVLALRLEGVARWDDAAMMRLSNGLTSYVLDIPRVTSSKDSFAAGVTGSETVAEMPPTTYRSRLTVSRYAETSIPAFMVWDGSGTIETLSLQVFGATESNPSSPSNAGIATSMLFVEMATAGAPSGSVGP